MLTYLLTYILTDLLTCFLTYLLASIILIYFARFSYIFWEPYILTVWRRWRMTSKEVLTENPETFTEQVGKMAGIRQHDGRDRSGYRVVPRIVQIAKVPRVSGGIWNASLARNVWDIGGQKAIRPYWSNYFENTDAPWQRCRDHGGHGVDSFASTSTMAPSVATS